VEDLCGGEEKKRVKKKRGVFDAFKSIDEKVKSARSRPGTSSNHGKGEKGLDEKNKRVISSQENQGETRGEKRFRGQTIASGGEKIKGGGWVA